MEKKELIEISKLYYHDNLSQDEIAKIFFTSRSTISRALDLARKNGLVKVLISEVGFDSREIEDRLRNTFSLEAVHVVPVSQADQKAVSQITAKSSAPFVSKFLHNGDRIGMAWGSTLYELIRNLPSISMPETQIVQLLGNTDSAVVKSYAHEIIEAASILLGTMQAYTVTCPIMTENIKIRDSLFHDARIKQVLDMARNCNKMFVNLALPNQYSCLFQSGYISDSDLLTLEKANAVGSLCCHFLDEKGALCDNSMDQRTITVGLDDIFNAELVFACVTDPRKTKILHASLSKNYINVLMIDSISANRLLQYNEEIG